MQNLGSIWREAKVNYFSSWNTKTQGLRFVLQTSTSYTMQRIRKTTLSSHANLASYQQTLQEIDPMVIAIDIVCLLLFRK